MLTNDYGEEYQDADDYPTVCSLQQARRDEPELAGETSDTYWQLFLPAGTPLGTDDTVTVEGRVYELHGDPWDADQTPATAHVEAYVRRTAGGAD